MAIKIFVLSLLFLSLCHRSLCFDDNDNNDEYDHKFGINDDDDDDEPLPVKDENNANKTADIKKQSPEPKGINLKVVPKSEDKQAPKSEEKISPKSEEKLTQKSVDSNSKTDLKLTKSKNETATPGIPGAGTPGIRTNTDKSVSNAKISKSSSLPDIYVLKPKIRTIKPQLKIAPIIPVARKVIVVNNKNIKPVNKEKPNIETDFNYKNTKVTQSDHQDEVISDSKTSSDINSNDKEKLKNVASKNISSKIPNQSDKQSNKDLSNQKNNKTLCSEVLKKASDAKLVNKTVETSAIDNVKSQSSDFNSAIDEEDDEDLDVENIISDVIPCEDIKKVNDKSHRDNITSEVLINKLVKSVITDTKEQSKKKPTLITDENKSETGAISPKEIDNLKNILQFRKAIPKRIQSFQPTTVSTPKIPSTNIPVKQPDLFNHLIIRNEDVKELCEKPKNKDSAVGRTDYTCSDTFENVGLNYNTWNTYKPITQEIPNSKPPVDYTYSKYPYSNGYNSYGYYNQQNPTPSYYQGQNTGTEYYNNYYSPRTNPVNNWNSNNWYQWPQRNQQVNYYNQGNYPSNSCRSNPGFYQLSPVTTGQAVPSVTTPPDKVDQFSLIDNPITSYNYQEVKFPYKNLDRILRHWHKTQVIIKRNNDILKSYQN